MSPDVNEGESGDTAAIEQLQSSHVTCLGESVAKE